MRARKRFYKDVVAVAAGHGWMIKLDSRSLRSPAGAELVLPTASLAETVAMEWSAQQDEIDPASMPMFSLAVTVIDRVMSQQPAIIDELTGYGGNDLLCYRADDADLAARQQQQWQPWLDWAHTEFGVQLAVATGIMPLKQPEAARFYDPLKALDAWRLGVLHRAVTLGGSLVLGLGFLTGRLDAETLFATAFLDELWQSENWGSDYEAEDRRATIRAELGEAARFLGLLAGRTANARS